MKTELLFVLGAPKTCTSTIMGILNLHPEIFIMSECFFKKEIKHGAKYYKYYNIKQRHMFDGRKSISSQYNKLYNIINEKSDTKYRYFGDKWACIASVEKMSSWIDEFKNHKVIFTIRDIRTWLTNATVKGKTIINNNAYQASLLYLYYFIKSFQYKNILYIKLEDFVYDNFNVLSKIDDFIYPLNISKYADEWWNKIGKYNDVNKNIHKWWEFSKESSFVQPKVLDISVEIKNNIMWGRVLPLFDKYYNNIDFKFSLDEVSADLNKIKEYLSEDVFVATDDCYTSVNINKI